MNLGTHIGSSALVVMLLLSPAASAQDATPSPMDDHRTLAVVDAPERSREIRVVDTYDPQLVLFSEVTRAEVAVVVEAEQTLLPWPGSPDAPARSTEFRIIDSEPQLAPMPDAK